MEWDNLHKESRKQFTDRTLAMQGAADNLAEYLAQKEQPCPADPGGKNHHSDCECEGSQTIPLFPTLAVQAVEGKG